MEYIKGMTWGWVGKKGTWKTKQGKESMSEMKKLDVTWTAIAFQGVQEHAHSTHIKYNSGTLISDEEVEWAIQNAHDLGLKVCLKPVVNCEDGTWRAFINFFDVDVPREPNWSEWFASYEAFILHYAEMAERTGCEMFCVGCEMVMTDRREKEWRALIKKVRDVYHGIVTYNCDKYQEENVTWWDAVDVVSSSGYYPTKEWPERATALKTFVESVNKPFFFMETGCPSRKGSGRAPNDWSLQGEPDGEEQVAFYQAMFDALGDQEWFYGFMLWDWPAELYSLNEADKNDDYCVYGKPAARVVQSFYSSLK